MNEQSKHGVTAPKQEGAVRRSVDRPLSPFDEMERMFEGFFPRRWMRPMSFDWPVLTGASLPFEGRIPKIDVVERDNEVVVRAEVPGVDKKDLDISVTDHTVTIKGCTKEEHQEEKGNYFRSEISQGSFSRTSALPCEVDGDKARASFSDGVLELTIPKLEASKRHTIKVE